MCSDRRPHARRAARCATCRSRSGPERSSASPGWSARASPRSARACFGLERVAAGSVLFAGATSPARRRAGCWSRGFFYLPPDRRAEGLVMSRGGRENIALPSLDRPQFSGPVLLDARSRGAARRAPPRRARRIYRPLRLERDIEHFSGGNQQKVMMAKALSREVRLFIFDEPTVGVDVGTRVAIYSFIARPLRGGRRHSPDLLRPARNPAPDATAPTSCIAASFEPSSRRRRSPRTRPRPLLREGGGLMTAAGERGRPGRVAGCDMDQARASSGSECCRSCWSSRSSCSR